MAEHGRIRPSAGQGHRLADVRPGGNSNAQMKEEEIPNKTLLTYFRNRARFLKMESVDVRSK